MHNLLTDIEGVAVGHATDLKLGSGVTAIVFDEPGRCLRFRSGRRAGRTRYGPCSIPAMTVQVADAFVLSGGSAFGLDAAGRRTGGPAGPSVGGLPVGTTRVPIVPQAILMDLLNGGDKDWGLHSPYRDMGYEAFCAAGKNPFALGSGGRRNRRDHRDLQGRAGFGQRHDFRRREDRGHRRGECRWGLQRWAIGPHFWSAPFEQEKEFGGLGQPERFSPDHYAMRLKGREFEGHHHRRHRDRCRADQSRSTSPLDHGP